MRYYCKCCGYEEEAGSFLRSTCEECFSKLYIKVDGEYCLFEIKKAEDIEEGDEIYLPTLRKTFNVLGIRETTKKWKEAISIGYEGHRAISYYLDELLICKTYN